ncbi:MAG: glycoside hydrolase family 99-like domain-containing protein [Kiritimatiellae bacterium]|nr:glycoside hydrolase family 99-like domain-containing protein [Kiritimatiellia bacterium]
MKQYDIAAYIWPSYHYEPRMEHFWPEKDGEWYTVRRGTPHFPGHDMPRLPLLGYQDESDPKVMREHIKLAREHGINVFIMDWYWYENAACFERQLNEGLIPALEGTDSKFFLMWANHDVTNLWDMHNDTSYDKADIQMTGQVDRKVLEPMFNRVIQKYLTHDNYYRIDDKPVFSIFDYPNLIKGLGGIQETTDAFAWMRQRCKDEGMSGLNIQAIARLGGGGVEGGATLEKGSEFQTARALGFDGATSYQYCMDAGEEGDYVTWAHKAISTWENNEKAYETFYPHASIGWDNTHRNPSQKTAVRNATPDAFEACLWKARQYLDNHPDQAPLVTLNSWNEWTEGSYLLPDMRWGYRYLQAVRNVFGDS